MSIYLYLRPRPLRPVQPGRHVVDVPSGGKGEFDEQNQRTGKIQKDIFI